MTDEKNSVPKRAYSVVEFCQMFGICRSTFYKQTRAGEINIVSIGNRTLILEIEVRRYISALQTAANKRMASAL